jgi:hypothetical protein
MLARLPLLGLADWMEIKTNYMIVVTAKMNVLLIPIVDKFYVSPSDPAAESRGIDLAVAKGFYSHPNQLQQT